jgi:glycolate oxidase iron-sulfur subunit
VTGIKRPRLVVDEAKLRKCVHCGFCLPVCPTYLELGTEADSPRGRIYLMRAIEEGRAPLSAEAVRHFDLCLGCRACETACPSGVPYGELIEETRAFVETTYDRPNWHRLRRAGIQAVFSHPRRLRLLLAPVKAIQSLGLFRFVEKVVPAARLVPRLGKRARLPLVSRPQGELRAHVGLFPGCVSAALFGDVHHAALRVLTRNGVRVFVPAMELCCGALHLHTGDPETARDLARRVVRAFPDELDAVIVTAAGCGATMKAYGDLLKVDALYADRARVFAAKVRDITEYLADLPLDVPEGRMEARVACHDPCHLAHVQGVRDAPRTLLRMIPGVELVELAESDVCCGSAGSYNLTEPDMARRLQRRKVDNIVRAGVTCLVAANPGCSLQIQAGFKERGLAVRVAHPVELLDEAYSPRCKLRFSTDDGCSPATQQQNAAITT